MQDVATSEGYVKFTERKTNLRSNLLVSEGPAEKHVFGGIYDARHN